MTGRIALVLDRPLSHAWERVARRVGRGRAAGAANFASTARPPSGAALPSPTSATRCGAGHGAVVSDRADPARHRRCARGQHLTDHGRQRSLAGQCHRGVAIAGRRAAGRHRNPFSGDPGRRSAGGCFPEGLAASNPLRAPFGCPDGGLTPPSTPSGALADRTYVEVWRESVNGQALVPATSVGTTGTTARVRYARFRVTAGTDRSAIGQGAAEIQQGVQIAVPEVEGIAQF